MPVPQLTRQETLAARLTRGSLALPYALRCATDVAAALRELHEANEAHGDVRAECIYVSGAGATLAATISAGATAKADVAAFGKVLTELVVEPEHAPDSPPRAVPRQSLQGVRNAALGLAARCMRAVEAGSPDMRQVVTEVRLLGVQANQYPAEAPAPKLAAVRSAAARQRLTPKAGPRLVDRSGSTNA